MKIICECCGNDEPTMFFDSPEVTMCMICGEVQVDHIQEDKDIAVPVFFE